VTKERKNNCDSNHIVCSQTNLKGTTLLSDSEITQKSRDSGPTVGSGKSVRHNSILIYNVIYKKDTFLQLSDSDEGKKKQVRLKSYRVFPDKLEGNHIAF
jgi:hypothetical protein